MDICQVCGVSRPLAVAAKWWASALMSPSFDNGDAFQSGLATSLKGPGLTQDDAHLFEAALVAELSKEEHAGPLKEEHLVLSTDYGPDDVLYRAYVTALGREPARHSFPWKTAMRFRAGGVCVSVGRGAPFVSIAG